MSNLSLKDTVDRLKSLEAEKLSLIAEVENLKREADTKANALVNEIAVLREEINSLKVWTEQGKPQLSSEVSLKERNLASLRALAGKTLEASNLLGSQVFASSPFTQHFDDWIASLRQTVLDFESHSPILMDEHFVRERSKIFLDVEGALAQKRVEESNLSAVTKALVENDHLLAAADKEYAEKARELSLKRDLEVEHLSNQVNELERKVQVEEENNSKRKILKKKTEDKLPQTRQDLKSAKNELEMARQNFAAEQGKLLDDYERKKQDIRGQVEVLRKELEKLETDTSIEARQGACKALANAVNALVERTSSIA